MKYYYLSSLQKTDIFITTLLFCIFIGFLKPLLLDMEINSRDVITFTLLFFVWYGSTLLFTNAFTYEKDFNKLANI
jgi:hypothetical protein